MVPSVASWPAYRFLRRQVKWSGIPISKNFPQFVVIHTVKGFHIVKEEEADVFLEFPCFLYDPVNVGNLISGSSAFSKPSLYIWKFSVHVLLKPSLKDFEHKLARLWNKHSCMVAWTFLPLLPINPCNMRHGSYYMTYCVNFFVQKPGHPSKICVIATPRILWRRWPTSNHEVSEWELFT